MPKLPRVSSDETIRAFERPGFVRVRQRGSHVVLKRNVAGREIGCVVPRHPELATGTLRGILRLAGVSPEEFLKALGQSFN